jgi:hypothetical protein
MSTENHMLGNVLWPISPWYWWRRTWQETLHIGHLGVDRVGVGMKPRKTRGNGCGLFFENSGGFDDFCSANLGFGDVQ